MKIVRRNRETAQVKRRECTCGKYGAEYGQPHEPGCPSYRDRSASREILEALERRFRMDEGEWLFFREWQHIDAYAIRCWGSGMGYRRVAMEVKVSRGDFLAELRKPSKRALALELSHEYLFVVPHGLVQAHEVPKEAGLMYVRDGKTRIVKKALLRQPRAFKLSECVSLMRMPLFRGGVLELRRQALVAQQRAEGFSEREDVHRQQLERAHERLLDLGGHLIERGSMWQGRWQPRSWIPPVEGVQVYVEEVRDRHVSLRRVDNGEIASHVWKVDLLTDFSRLDMRAVA